MMDLLTAFRLGPQDLISLVGAGGKTTLMYRLAAQLSRRFGQAISTTTTRIWPPGQQESPCILYLPPGASLSPGRLKETLARQGHVTLVSEPLPSKKLKGLEPSRIEELKSCLPGVPIVVEADGAAQRSLKVPAPWEPVIPEATTLVIAVVGIDVLDQRLTEEHVFRAQQAAQLLGIQPGERITEEHIALILSHPQGVIKGSPAASRIMVFINKVELLEDLSRARRLAERVLLEGAPRTGGVVLGSARSGEVFALVGPENGPSQKMGKGI